MIHLITHVYKWYMAYLVVQQWQNIRFANKFVLPCKLH